MIIISDTIEFHIPERTAVAFGKFDGIHIGHRMLFDKVLTSAKENGLKSLVFTFSPSPLVFFGGSGQKELSTLKEKRRLFEELGFDYLVEFPLTKETAATKPADFVREYLCEKMNSAMIFAGDDVSFGDRGAGDSKLLLRMQRECDYELCIIGKKYYEGKVVSSTLVRSLIAGGEMEEAGKLLGKPYEITAVVSEGGSVCAEAEKLLPGAGNYPVTVCSDTESVKGELIVMENGEIFLANGVEIAAKLPLKDCNNSHRIIFGVSCFNSL